MVGVRASVKDRIGVGLRVRLALTVNPIWWCRCWIVGVVVGA